MRRCRRISGPLSTALPAGEVHDGRPPRHDRRGGWASHPACGAGPWSPHWTAYGVYASQNAAIQSLAAKDLQLDLALADYGPEARDARLQLRDGLRKTIDEIWRTDSSNDAFAAKNLSLAIHSLHARQAELNKLHPETEQQRRALAAATATVDALAQARLQMSFALSGPVSIPFMSVVLGWAVLIFCGFGLMSQGNPMSIAVAIIGALAVASAFHMIIDLGSPYSGTFQFRQRRSRK